MADIASDTFPSPSQLLHTGGYSEHTGDTVNRYREIRKTNNMSDIASYTIPSPSQLLHTGGYSEHAYLGNSQQIQGNKEYKQYV